MFRTSNVLSNTTNNSDKLQNQFKQQNHFLNLIDLENSVANNPVGNSGISVTGVITTAGDKIETSNDMKTDNVLLTTVKVEPLNYTVGTNSQFNDGLYAKRPRLER